MKFEDAKLIYQYFMNDWEVHDLTASFDNEETAIQFGVNNIMEEKGKRHQRLYDLEIALLYNSMEQYEAEPHAREFWDQYNANADRIEEEIANRVKELSKKS